MKLWLVEQPTQAKSLSWGCGENIRASQEVQGKSPLTHGFKKNGTPPYKKRKREKKRQKRKRKRMKKKVVE